MTTEEMILYLQDYNYDDETTNAIIARLKAADELADKIHFLCGGDWTKDNPNLAQDLELHVYEYRDTWKEEI